MDLEHLFVWSKRKGIDVVATGDFTHPEWFNELQQKLEPAEPGLYKLKAELEEKLNNQLSASLQPGKIRFLLSTEISTIYSKDGRVRKLHQVAIAPSFKSVTKINTQLEKIGNLTADGRPILGLDSQELLKIVLEADSDNLYIPAHIWTPWFAMFGSKSGFDSIEQAFGDLATEVKAVETGLSSDPAMNWRLSGLDGVTLVSNSDAHSPRKLGREANLIQAELDYYQIVGAVKSGDHRFVGTIEFFPQEGKYHWDGHRKCDLVFSPKQTHQHQGICPRCSKLLVLGVDHRVDQLADRSADFKPISHKQVEYIIPLPEIIAEVEGVKGAQTKTVQTKYRAMLAKLGSELGILREKQPDQIRQAGFAKTAEAICRMRAGQVQVKPGYDGVYGQVRLFSSRQETKDLAGQTRLFG
ncbi:MAG: hypothetical protein GF381_00360 [Candidatus Pacebacteria bacterium]|nr:hypothetical protein [Candidatus Paceibacterota bacterium]